MQYWRWGRRLVQLSLAPVTKERSHYARPSCVVRSDVTRTTKHKFSTADSSNIVRRDIFPNSDDTIYALSTAPGRAAIAVIRVSGPSCLAIYQQLCPKQPPPKPRTATLRKLRSPNDTTRVLDTGALVLFFPAPQTVTGEDVLELHVHGGPAIVRSVLEAIPQAVGTEDETAKARPAEAGEFTKRAFYNGRIDLTEVEALGEALVAETEQQRRLAVSGATSGLTQRYEEWRSMLLYARGELEALIDFSEDQHFDESPAEFMSSVSKQVVELKRQLGLHILNASRGELLRSGISVALLGAPNAGKSSLLNRIVGREAAIVSAEEGTTRDIVDVTIDIQGWLVRLGDMAGVRTGLSPSPSISEPEANAGQSASFVGEIEREGIRRARERALQSDLVIVLVSLQPTAQGSIELAINDELLDAVHECRMAGKEMLFALTKIDLLHCQTGAVRLTISRLLSQLTTLFPGTSSHDVFCLSCYDADTPNPDEPDAGGLQTFLSGLTSKFSSMTSAAVGEQREHGEIVAITSTEAQSYWTASLSVTHRQSVYLRECLTYLEAFLEGASAEPCFDPGIQMPPMPLQEVIVPRSSAHSNGYFATEDSVNSEQPWLAKQQSRYHIDNYKDLNAETRGVSSSSATKAEPINKSSTGINLEMPSNDSMEVDIVTAAEHLRHAADCLAKLTGRGDGVSSGADVEDVLGVVFEK